MPLATMSDAVREYARNVGAERRDQAWIVSPYDTWERNPFYSGPPQPHPEDNCGDDWEADMLMDAQYGLLPGDPLPAADVPSDGADPFDDDLPF